MSEIWLLSSIVSSALIGSFSINYSIWYIDIDFIDYIANDISNKSIAL